MLLSPTQRKFLVHDQIIGAAVVNLVFNALIAWLTFRHHSSVPMVGDQSIVGDTIATSIALPLLTCLIVTPLVRKAIQSGKVEPLATTTPELQMLHWLPSLSFLRGLVLALCSLAWTAPLLLGLLAIGQVESMSVGGFVFVKAVYAGALAALVCPVIALHVLATTSAAPNAEADEATAAWQGAEPSM